MNAKHSLLLVAVFLLLVVLRIISIKGVEGFAVPLKTYIQYPHRYYDQCQIQSSNKNVYRSFNEAKAACDADPKCKIIEQHDDKNGVPIFFYVCNDAGRSVPSGIDAYSIRCGGNQTSIWYTGKLPDLPPGSWGYCPDIDCEAVPNAWSACSTKCGAGTQTRTYKIIKNREGIGKACPPTETRPCSPANPPCKVDCIATAGAWSQCSTQCGPGTQTRFWNVSRQAANGGKLCPAPENRPCQPSNLPCDVNCVATAKPWSSCSKDCGPGVQTQEWTVTTQPRGKGAACPATVTRQCSNKPCPVNCVIARTWYTPNDAKCERDPAKPQACGNGNGRILQKRDITPAMNGGTCVDNATTRYVPCDLPPCPIDCKVSAFGAFGACTKPSPVACGPGGGLKTRTRTVAQANSTGRKCTTAELKTSETAACDLPACPTNCRVGEWSAWSQCEGKCDKGQQKRTRTVTEGTNGGRLCTPAEKVTEETRECPLQPCVNTDALYEIKRMRPFQYPVFDMYKAGRHQSFPSPA